MSQGDAILAAAGVYLALGLLVSAWRRQTEGAGGVSAWVALLGVWTIGMLGGRRSFSPWQALAVSLAFVAGAFLLVRLGHRLGRRAAVRGWVWVLGPVQAIGLAVLWLVEGRRREARRRQADKDSVEEADVAREAGLAQETEPGRRTELARDADPARNAGLPSETGAALEAGRADERATGSPARRAASDALIETRDSVVALGRTTVGEVMTARSEMQALPESATVADAARLALETRHPFVPVYRTELDEIAGYVRISDLFSEADGARPIAPFVREARFVPETMRCDDLLRDLLAHQERLAIVVDEFGGTAGLVRDEDLFRILLGELDREEALEAEVARVAPGVYLAKGPCRVDDFNALSRDALPEGDYETVAGLALARFGRIPAAGESLDIDGARLEVLASTARRILRLRIIVKKEQAVRSKTGEQDRVHHSG